LWHDSLWIRCEIIKYFPLLFQKIRSVAEAVIVSDDMPGTFMKIIVFGSGDISVPKGGSLNS
jgi:hypothetical protein